MFAFLKSLLGTKPVPLVPAPSARAAPVMASVVQAPLVLRTEIIDARNRLCGYRFTVPSANAQQALAETLVLAALAAAGVAAFAERRLALVPLSAEAIVLHRHLPLQAPHTVFLLDVQQAGLPPAQLAGRLRALRDSGSQVGLCGIRSVAEQAALLAECDVVVLTLTPDSLVEFQALKRQIRSAYPAIRLLVDGVASWDEQRMCQSLGFSYCMGDFLTTADQIDAEAKIDQSRLTSIELLNLLRSEAELTELIEVAKRDPGMTYQMLQWANAPANGQSTTVTSLHQAFLVLGRNQLYRDLMVSMFRLGGAGNQARDEALLEVALRRARFLETVAQGVLAQATRDELFLVGLLSLFEVLLGMPMAQLVGSMQLSADIRSVLLHSEGPYAPYLMLVLLLERNKLERAIVVARTLQLDPNCLGPVTSAAFQWAQESIGLTASDDGAA
ncbi:MAG: EAL and HDOD domain-containing protein [Sphingomonadaceae bacterium]